MSVFKKVCFSCGKKVDNLKDGMCIDCYKDSFPPIKDIKPLNIKICNQCSKIYLSHSLISLEEFKERLPFNMTKAISLNEGYVLKDLAIKNFKLNNSKISFDLEVDCDFKKDN